MFPPYVIFVCLYGRLISEFNFEIKGSHVCCTRMLVLCSILCLTWSGSSLYVVCIFWDVVFVCVKMGFVKIVLTDLFHKLSCVEGVISAVDHVRNILRIHSTVWAT